MNTVDDHQPAGTIVRRAAVADIPAMVMIGKRFFDETGYAKFGIFSNPNKLHESLEKAVSDDAYGAFVAERAGAIVGVACAVSFAMYFSEQPVAMELFWWVDPNLRGGAPAIRLMAALERWAEDSGCVTFSMVDLVNIKSSAPKIYERRGYKLVERTWIKRIN